MYSLAASKNNIAMKKLFFIFFAIAAARSHAQNIAINNTGSTAHASAMLDISSGNKGLLIPRVQLASLTDAVTIASPAQGLLVFNLNSNAIVSPGFYYNSGTTNAPAWVKLIDKPGETGGWSLNGNNVSTTDFIGTTNNRPLRFGVNDQKAGLVDYLTQNTALGYLAYSGDSSFIGVYNVALGTTTMASNKSGSSNCAIGRMALYSNTIGNQNIAVGQYSLYNNIDGESNIAIGQEALYSNAKGKQNIALGYYAIGGNVSGINNIGIGYRSMANNLSGNTNVAIGYEALYSNRSGNYNVANGAFALRYDTSGSYNIATGYNAMFSNISGDNNIAAGYNTLYYNTTGSDNIAIGREALQKNQAASKNVAIGYYSLGMNVTGNDNTAIGTQSLANNSNGKQNTAVGNGALFSNTSGNKNTAIGYYAVANASDSNTTVIGANTKSDCSNCVVLGPEEIALNTGIGISKPETNLHINTKGAGSILLGKSKASGSATSLEMGITLLSGGHSYIQSTAMAGTAGGMLLLNPAGGRIGIKVDTALTDVHIKQSSDVYPLNGNGLRFERKNTTDHWDVGADYQNDLDFVFNGVAKAYLNDATGALVTVSDARLKKNIQSLAPVISSIVQLQPKKYYYNDNKTGDPLSYGFIAQEVEKIFPDLVFTKGNDEMKAVSYQGFTIVAIKAIQEQQQTIQSLEERIAALEAVIKGSSK